MPTLRPWTPIFIKDLKYGTQARPGILVGSQANQPTTVTATVSVLVPTIMTSIATFNCTGANQSWTVPAGVTFAKFTIRGAGGSGGPNGLGCEIIGYRVVTPGEIFTIVVGCQSGWPNGGVGGNAGAFAGFPGGGSSDIRPNGGAFSDAYCIAGAGGGAGETSASNPNPFGGNGGLTTGGNSNANTAHGATPGAGGTGGPGGDGSAYQGGNALGSGNSFHFGSGGGGGGAFGGEGGLSTSPPGQSGGGGGNSFVHPSMLNVTSTDGAWDGNGQIVIQW